MMKKKKKLYFEEPYIGYEEIEDISIVYGVKGNPISIFEIVNPVLESCSDIEEYQKAHNTFLQLKRFFHICKNLVESSFIGFLPLFRR